MKIMQAAALAAVVTLAAGAKGDSAKKTDAFEKRTFTGASGKTIPYRLLKPIDYDPKGTTTYPLILVLHGSGERGTDNEMHLVEGIWTFAKPEMRQKHPCFVVAPQCPEKKSWSTIKKIDGHEKLIKTDEPTESTGLALELVDALAKEYRIDGKRLYLTGLSMGGFGAWDILYRYPDRFAAVMPLCGGGIEETAPLFAKVPIWVFHSTNDDENEVEQSRTMVNALRKAGGKPGYTEYPNGLHDCWTRTYQNMYVFDWLFKQKKP